MENQETTPISGQLDNFFNIAFDPATRAQVRQAAVWAKVCTLCAFVGYGIALIVAIFGRPNYSGDTEGARVTGFLQAGNLAGVLIGTLIGVTINYFLYRFAVAAIRGMDTMDSIKTNEGFDNLRLYFKIIGILLIIVFSFGALALLFVIGAGLGR